VPHPSQPYRDGWDRPATLSPCLTIPPVVILAQPQRFVILAQPESLYSPLLVFCPSSWRSQNLCIRPCLFFVRHPERSLAHLRQTKSKDPRIGPCRCLFCGGSRGLQPPE
jgi:hypothetical protein